VDPRTGLDNCMARVDFEIVRAKNFFFFAAMRQIVLGQAKTTLVESTVVV
jgi:hypothetical protein